MIIIKFIILFSIFVISIYLGLVTANKYRYRVKDLKQIRSILNILETNIKFTYKPLPQIFSEIYNQFEGSVRGDFLSSKRKNERRNSRSFLEFCNR